MANDIIHQTLSHVYMVYLPRIFWVKCLFRSVDWSLESKYICIYLSVSLSTNPPSQIQKLVIKVFNGQINWKPCCYFLHLGNNSSKLYIKGSRTTCKK